MLYIVLEPASSGRQAGHGPPMQSLRHTFLDGTDADLQRRLTPSPYALNIWHGEIGLNAHIRPSGHEACKGRKPAGRGS